MIGRLTLLHYLPEDVYIRVCRALGLDEAAGNVRTNAAQRPGEAIARAHLFNIEYKAFGHIWFMHSALDFPLFGCTYADFPAALYAAYGALLGEILARDLPGYDTLTCDYIEYTRQIPVADAADTMARLRAGGKFAPAQLDRAQWDAYKKPHATIALCLGAADATHLDALARCHGTALKRRITDPAAHHTVGLYPSVAVSEAAETAVMDWLLAKNGVPDA